MIELMLSMASEAPEPDWLKLGAGIVLILIAGLVSGVGGAFGALMTPFAVVYGASDKSARSWVSLVLMVWMLIVAAVTVFWVQSSDDLDNSRFVAFSGALFGCTLSAVLGHFLRRARPPLLLSLGALVVVIAGASVASASLATRMFRDASAAFTVVEWGALAIPVVGAGFGLVLLRREPRAIAWCAFVLSFPFVFAVGLRFAVLPMALGAACDVDKPCPESLFCAQVETAGTDEYDERKSYVRFPAGTCAVNRLKL